MIFSLKKQQQRIRISTAYSKIFLGIALLLLFLFVSYNNHDDHVVVGWIPTSLSSFHHRYHCQRNFISSVLKSSIETTKDTTSTPDITETTTTTTTTPPPVLYKLNPLLLNIKPSKTVEIFSLVKTMEAAGEVVTSLCVGEPDFLPENIVLEATSNAVSGNNAYINTKYSAVTGTIELRKAISYDLQRRKNITYNYMNEIVVGNGAKQCVFQAIWALVGVGDQVLIPAPYWPSYPEEVLLTGAEPIIISTNSTTGYLLTPIQLRETLTKYPNISLLILCNPSNPTGGVYEEELLRELCHILVYEFPHVRVLADEIYERLIYDNIKECISIASLPYMKERTLTINGFSKAYAMTGYRLGYVAAPAPYAKAIGTIQGQLTSCASTISQAAGVVALYNVSDIVFMNNAKIMQSKRDYVIQQLQLIPNIIIHKIPKGAFYVLPDISYYCKDHIDDPEYDGILCIELLQKYKLAVVPGSSFGAPGTIRISYATSIEQLEIAMNKLTLFFQEKREQLEQKQV